MAARYSVGFSRAAERDLADLHHYLDANAGREQASRLIDLIEASVATLEQFPFRGGVPKELLTTGLTHFRQTLVGRYRVIYTVTESTVTVMLIADGRRDMQALLTERLLRPWPAAD